MNDLVDFWRRCKLQSPPFAHPDDLDVLHTYSKALQYEPIESFDEFVTGNRFGQFEDSSLHLSLTPVPYIGDLKQAEIVILLLNPGLSYTDYWGENYSPEFRKRLTDNLYQTLEGAEFPFLGLDPRMCWYGGFVWWEKKLREVVRLIAAQRFAGQYLAALRDLSRKLACLELIPYHSSSFGDHRLITHLPSAQKMLEFVRKDLVSDAQNGSRTLVITRQANAWGLKEADNICLYEGGHTRGASLGPNTRGGQAILQRYKIVTDSSLRCD